MSDPCDVVNALRNDAELGTRVAHVETIPARPARYDDTTEPLHPEVVSRLEAQGIDALYTHQAQALDHLRAGTHTVVATGTASGKSLCYQVPIVEAAVTEGVDTALMMFPTKALAHDQLRSLHQWLVPDLDAFAYDGDTPRDQRGHIRKEARVLVTNPDMLHVGILPRHERWSTFFSRLRFVVVDELHALRGIFGSHVAQLLRRLRRVCAHYGASPTFCFSSATIGNPGDLASELCGLPVETVADDGSPRGERCFALWERPLVEPATGSRGSANVETARLVARLVEGGVQALAFTRSRNAAELVAAQVRDILRPDHPDLAERVASYRGGYLPEERRELEERISRGDLLGIAATNALELGIDVGGLDAVVLNGFPGTLASMWQQAGRAGREERRSAALLVAGDDQLDQWYLSHPRELFTRSPEPAVINPANPFILAPHLACAAYELPLVDDDADYFGEGIDQAVTQLVRDDQLRVRNGRLFWAGRRPPAGRVGLRSGSAEEFRLLESDTRALVGTVDGSRAFSVAHEGAVYLHQGRQFRVTELRLRDRTALLEEFGGDEYTQPREDTDLAVESVETSRPLGRSTVHLGEVSVTTTITGYQRKQTGTGEVIAVEDLDLPPRTLPTRACWYTVADDLVESLGFATPRLLGSLHAAEHALIGMLPLFAICDRWDVGGLSIALHPDTDLASIFIYDGYPGGAGVAELAYADAERHMEATLELLRSCPCDAGCPSCVQSPKCGNWNEYLDKAAAISLLTEILGS